MKRTLTLFALLLLAVSAQAQDLETVLARHYTAINEAAFDRMQPFKIYGMLNPDTENEAYLTVYHQDEQFRVEIQGRGVDDAASYFDGDRLRMGLRAEASQSPRFEPAEPEAEDALWAWFYSSVHRNALGELARGQKLKLDGKQAYDGREVYAIEATFRKHAFVEKGTKLTYLVDAQTYLVAGVRLSDGRAVRFSDYRAFQGANIPMSFDLEGSSFKFHKVVENASISKGFFANP